MSNISDPPIEITWKNTLNGSLVLSNNFFEHHVLVLQMAIQCNYPYFLLNDIVYETKTNQPTKLTREDLDYYYL